MVPSRRRVGSTNFLVLPVIAGVLAVWLVLADVAIGAVVASALRSVVAIGRSQHSNTASPMESHGEPNRIQDSEEFAAALGSGFELVPRGRIAVNGKSEVTTRWLERVRVRRGDPCLIN